ESLFAEGLFVRAERHLGAEFPRGRNVPGLGNFLIDQWVVVLEAGPDVCIGQCGPDRMLCHAARLFGPDREVVGGEREVFLKALNDILVFVEQNRTGTGSETVDLGFRLRESVGWHDLAQRFLDNVPELVALGAKQDYGSRTLRVERGRCVLDRLADQL